MIYDAVNKNIIYKPESLQTATSAASSTQEDEDVRDIDFELYRRQHPDVTVAPLIHERGTIGVNYGLVTKKAGQEIKHTFYVLNTDKKASADAQEQFAGRIRKEGIYISIQTDIGMDAPYTADLQISCTARFTESMKFKD